jgi:hypothetical protein
MNADCSVSNSPLVSDAKLRGVLHGQMHKAMKVQHRFTRTSLSAESGVNVHNMDQINASQGEKHRRVALEDALSIAVVLGEGAVNALLATIGYGGAKPLDEPDAMQPVQIAMIAMQQVGRIAKAAADNRIDHIEEPDTTEAADILIATVLPLSSAGRAA